MLRFAQVNIINNFYRYFAALSMTLLFGQGLHFAQHDDKMKNFC